MECLVIHLYVVSEGTSVITIDSSTPSVRKCVLFSVALIFLDWCKFHMKWVWFCNVIVLNNYHCWSGQDFSICPVFAYISQQLTSNSIILSKSYSSWQHIHAAYDCKNSPCAALCLEYEVWAKMNVSIDLPEPRGGERSAEQVLPARVSSL